MRTVDHGLWRPSKTPRVNFELASRIERAPRLLSARKRFVTIDELHRPTVERRREVTIRVTERIRDIRLLVRYTVRRAR